MKLNCEKPFVRKPDTGLYDYRNRVNSNSFKVNYMRVSILRWIISIFYGAATFAATIFAIFNHLSPVWVNTLMALAAVGIIISNFKPFRNKLIFISSWLFLIHICAVLNGYYTNDNQFLHHAVRLVVSLLVFSLFFFARKDRKNSIS